MGEAVAIVAGATGMVGQALVRQLTGDPTWREVRALVRHALPPELSAPDLVPVEGRLRPARASAALGDSRSCLLCPGHDHASGGLGGGISPSRFRVSAGAGSSGSGSRRPTLPAGDRRRCRGRLAGLLQSGEGRGRGSHRCSGFQIRHHRPAIPSARPAEGATPGRAARPVGGRLRAFALEAGLSRPRGPRVGRGSEAGPTRHPHPGESGVARRCCYVKSRPSRAEGRMTHRSSPRFQMYAAVFHSPFSFFHTVT